jgi:peptidoglycan/LPS O-acetylase OafA/YrhL
LSQATQPSIFLNAALPARADGASAFLRLGNIDLLRFCCALLVVLYHYTYTGHASHGLSPTAFPEFLPLTQHRWVGAWLFFMVSGFGIAYAARRGSPYDFLVARVARIYPSFLFCMCVTSLVLVVAAPQTFVEFQMTWSRWIANITMAPMVMKETFVDAVYWSILVEITFYMWVSVFLALGLFQKRLLEILGIWLVFSVFNEFFLDSALLNKVFLTRNACFFALGMVSYRVYAANRRPDFPEIILGVLSIILALKSDYTVNSWLQANYLYAAEWNLGISLLKTIGFLFLINMAVRAEPVMQRSVTTVMGGMSYPLYLLHSSLGFVLFHQLDGRVDRWTALALAYAMALSLAYLVARFIEPAGRELVQTLSSTLVNARTLRHGKDVHVHSMDRPAFISRGAPMIGLHRQG